MTSTIHLDGMVFAGESAFAERLRVQVQRIAPHFRTALLIGEPGSGKSDVARELHRLSPVAAGPFVPCSAEEFASGSADSEAFRFGTLYLTRIGALRAPSQEQLLLRLNRLDGRTSGETRLIAANDTPLRGLVASGRMRQELYARLATIEIRVASLRERLEDLPHMLAELRVHPEVHSRFKAHGWPGNLRELRDLLGEAFLASGGDCVELSHLPNFNPAPRASTFQEPAEARLDFVMKRHVADVLERCSGNKLRAAEMLGISRSTLYRMLDSIPTEI
jgi:DNA-binding NtrC family response regulator